MAATWDYASRLARRSEQIGFDLTLVAELNLNDIKGDRSAVAGRLVHGGGAGRGDRAAGDHGRGAADVPRAGAARQAGRQHRPDQRRRPAVAQRRVVVVGDEAKMYGVHFEQHDDRYARTAEWLDVVDGLWQRARLHARTASTTRVEDTVLRAEAGAEAAADDLRRRRIGGGQDADRAASATRS